MELLDFRVRIRPHVRRACTRCRLCILCSEASPASDPIVSLASTDEAQSSEPVCECLTIQRFHIVGHCPHSIFRSQYDRLDES